MRVRSWSRKQMAVVAAGIAVVPVVFTVSSAMTASPRPASVVVPVAPERILDTRNGVGTGGSSPVGADSALTLQVAGVGSVPTGATGVVLNLTGTQASTATYITAYPSGTARSTTSVLNLGPAADIANTITVALGSDGALSLYNFTGSVHLVADVTGYLLDAASIVAPPAPPSTPEPTTGTVTVGAYAGRFTSGAPSVFHYGCTRASTGGEIWYDVALPDGAIVTSVDIQHYDAAAAHKVNVDLFHSSWADPVSPTFDPVIAADLPDTGALFVTTSVPATPRPAVRRPDRAYLVVGIENSAQLLFCGADIHYTLT